MIRNTEHQYGFLAKIFHWSIAGIILGLLLAGFFMTSLAHSPLKLQIYGLHKSFGLLVLALAVLRLVWRFSGPVPAALKTHKPWERFLSKITHIGLYVCLLVMPLSGWVMSSAGDFPNSFFGFFEMPDLVQKDESIFRISREIHELTAFGLWGLVGLHMAGAFKHHFWDRDETLKRMSSLRFGFIGAAFLLLLAGGLWLGATAFIIDEIFEEALPSGESVRQTVVQEDNEEFSDSFPVEEAGSVPRWFMIPGRSRIEIEATQYGQVFSGQFKTFYADIYFNPDSMEGNHVYVAIDVSSLKTGSEDRDLEAQKPEWFNIKSFPYALFETRSFEKTGPENYTAKADLILRGIGRYVTLPFTLKIEKTEKFDVAIMEGELVLNRLDFALGQRSWQDTDAIGNPVTVKIHVEARRPVGQL